jgi:hypothetical protein
MKRFDHLAIGIAVGLITPVITLYLFYAFTYSSQTSFSGFIEYFERFRNLVPALSLCVISNLAVFFIFLWTNRNQSARGVVFATMAYAGWVVYRKFLS